MRKIRANLVLSFDFKSMICSAWIGCLLITWDNGEFLKTVEFSWYGFDYWDVQEVQS